MERSSPSAQVKPIVFEAHKVPPTTAEHEFAILESSHFDDDLVYAVPLESHSWPSACTGPVPSGAWGDPSSAGAQASIGSQESRGCSKQPSTSKEVLPGVGKLTPGPFKLNAMPSGKKVMSFEGFLSSEYCLFMADSGATHTFVSTQ